MSVLSDVRYQVFVSSTYDDLRVERQQATQTILEMGHLPTGMELFPASDLSQWELIKRVIDDSDYYVIIVGGRYGSVSKETGLSFTEMEYDYASSVGVPVLGFVRRDVSTVPAKHTELDHDKRVKLEAFRAKVLSRTCRLFDEASELGMLVMKSLMSETRLNPRIGWVRADRLRGEEDIAREKAVAEALNKSEKTVKKLERKIRDMAIPVDGIPRERLAQGPDKFDLALLFQDKNKVPVARDVTVTWDEIFSVIGARMYGYTVRRTTSAYGNQEGPFPCEDSLIDYLRTKVYEDCGNRQIKILSHQVDAIMIQFKQLGLMEMRDHDKDEKGNVFRGFCLTALGEEHLTRLSIRTTDAT